MSNNQLYLLVGLYVYLNFFLSMAIIKEDFKVMIKVMTLIFIWCVPLIGYFSVATLLIINDTKLDNKGKNIATLIAAIAVYGIILLMF